MSTHREPRPRDHADVLKDIARDLSDIASQISSFKGEANAYLDNPNSSTLRLRLENAHAAVEAAMVEARRRVRNADHARLLPVEQRDQADGGVGSCLGDR